MFFESHEVERNCLGRSHMIHISGLMVLVTEILKHVSSFVKEPRGFP